MKLAETFPASDKGSVESIISYNLRTKSYRVWFDGSDTGYTVHVKYLHRRFHQVSDIERRFREAHGIAMSA